MAKTPHREPRDGRASYLISSKESRKSGKISSGKKKKKAKDKKKKRGR